MLTSIRRVVLLCVVLGSLVSLSAQTLPGSYAPVPAPQFLTDAGAPCAGCDLYTYASGTTTPLATYTDVGLTTPNANPIVLDSAGRATIFLSNTTYKFVLKTSGGVTIWTRDTVASVAQMAASVISTTLQVVQSNSSTGTLNDFALTANAGTLKMSNASLATITGLSAGYDGQQLVIVSTGAGQVDISNQAAGSAAANRVINPVTGTISLAAGSGKATLQYDTTAARWRVIAHEQGAWIAVPYASGNFTGSAGTWTVDAGDQTTLAYLLRGRTLNLTAFIVTTTVASPGTQLKIAVPDSLICAREMGGSYEYADNATQGAGLWEAAPSATVVNFFNATLGNWTASTNATAIRATIAFEVQ